MNRRNFLKMMGVGAGTTALIGAPGWNSSWDASFLDVLAQGSTEVVDPVWHALNRLTYAPLPGQVDAVKKMGLPAYIDQQLAPDKIDDSATDALLSGFTTLNMTVPELYAQQVAKQQGKVAAELDSATVLRAIYSQRQLLEVMVNFWSEHFNIWHKKDLDLTLKTADDRDVIRKFALGKFRDLLGASAHSPAMIWYLDNEQNVKAHPNENYGRELMELHTLGVGNYTETDVQNVARAFTGWAMNPANLPKDKGTTTPTPKPNAFEFLFNKNNHDTAAKTILGTTLPAGRGIEDGEQVLDIMAAHPATAMHLATKLAHRFISDTPSDAAVSAIAQAFTHSSGDIAATLRALFALPDFTNAAPKFKRPWEYTISLMRALNVQIDHTKPVTPILSVLQSMGQLPFDHDMADGYSDLTSAWTGNLLPRWNLSINTLYGYMPNVKVDLNAIVTSLNVTIEPTAVINFFAQHLYGRPLTANESKVLLAYLNQAGTPDLTTTAGRQTINDTLALMLAATAFQYR